MDCTSLQELDRKYDTPKLSPLHHDNRCQDGDHWWLATIPGRFRFINASNRHLAIAAARTFFGEMPMALRPSAPPLL